MNGHGFVSLGLADACGAQRVGSDTEAEVLRRIVGEAFAAVAEALDAVDPMRAELLVAADRCRSLTRESANADSLESLSRTGFASLRRHAAQARERDAGHREDIAAVVAKVREAVAVLGGSHTSLDQALTGSAERFARLTGVDDVSNIQALLGEEVERLKRLAIEQRTAWERTRDDFDRRIASLQHQLASTRREADIDSLTGVANRRRFERVFHDCMAQRSGFVVALVDVDDFKAVNDRNGHAAGDRVLAAVASALTSSVRSGDIVARLGGDEFAIIAPTLTLVQAERRFRALIDAVSSACRPIVPAGAAVSVSVGIAELSAGDTADAVYARADAALYRAKTTGKRRVVANASPFIRDLLNA